MENKYEEQILLQQPPPQVFESMTQMNPNDLKHLDVVSLHVPVSVRKILNSLMFCRKAAAGSGPTPDVPEGQGVPGVQ